MSSTPTPSAEILRALEQHQRGDLAAAHRVYQAVLGRDPDDFHANLLLGSLLHQSGRTAMAEPLLERAITICPQVPDPWVNLAIVCQHLGKSGQAEAHFRQALVLDDSLVNAWLGLGTLAQANGQDKTAREAYARAQACDPDNPLPAYNLATLHLEKQRYRAAIQAADQALERAATLVEALGVRADALIKLGQAEEALTAINTAREMQPDDANLAYTEGFALTILGRLPAALMAFEQALTVQPDHGGAIAAALFCRRQLCAWDGTERLLERFRDGIKTGLKDLTPFSFLAEASTRREQLDCAALWSKQWAQEWRDPLPPVVRPAEKKITIAYLSADYYRHPTAYLAAGLFESHDRSRFRVLAYSNSRDEGSPIRQRLEAAFDDFIDIREMSPRAAAERMRNDGVDILIDLKGHTREASTAVLALRPAPVMVQYLGYPGTMGAPFIDYLIGDHWVTPAAHQQDYSEHLVQLPISYQVNDRQRPLPEQTTSRVEHGLPAGGTVFCCFNNAWKFQAETFATWMEILHGTPGSVLWLLGRQSAPQVARHLRALATDAGIDPGRLVFSKSRPLEAYLELYHHADLFLDSWPYNAHTTASDALWMGCPVLTLAGETFASRVGASLLAASGLEQLICESRQDYVNRALELARNPGVLAQLRQQLISRRLSNPLFDTVATTRHIEAAYEEMWRRQTGGGASGFAVPLNPPV